MATTDRGAHPESWRLPTSGMALSLTSSEPCDKSYLCFGQSHGMNRGTKGVRGSHATRGNRKKPSVTNGRRTEAEEVKHTLTISRPVPLREGLCRPNPFSLACHLQVLWDGLFVRHATFLRTCELDLRL